MSGADFIDMFPSFEKNEGNDIIFLRYATNNTLFFFGISYEQILQHV